MLASSTTAPGLYSLRPSDGVLCRGTHIAEKLVFSKVKEALGLDRCKYFYTGAAKTKTETVEFLATLGIGPLCEVYGLSEGGLSAVGGNNVNSGYLPGSIGAVSPGTVIKLVHDKTRGDREGEGELLYRSRSVMAGYLNQQDKTDDAIDSEGFLHTGDLCVINEFNMLTVSGRAKEILIGSGGENIAVPPIESKMTAVCNGVSTAIVIAEQKKYCTMLVGLKQKPNLETGGWLDELAPEAVEVDPHCVTVADAIKSEKWKAYLEGGIRKTNAVASSNACTIQKFRILPRDVSIPEDTLTPTMKLKRRKVDEVHKALIDEMYAE